MLRMRFNWRALLARTVLSILIVGLLYGVIWLLPRYVKSHHKTPSQELSSLNVAVNDNILAFSNLAGTKGNSVDTAAQLIYQREHLKQTVSELENKVNHHSHKLPESLFSDVYTQLDSQKKLLEAYDTRYGLFTKAIQYNPSKDLSLDLNQQKEAVIARTGAAINALKTLTTNPNLKTQEKLQTTLSDAIGCFDEFENQVTSTSSQATSTRSRCITLYDTFRGEAILYVVSAFPADDTQKILDGFKQVQQTITKNVTSGN